MLKEKRELKASAAVLVLVLRQVRNGVRSLFSADSGKKPCIIAETPRAEIVLKSQLKLKLLTTPCNP
jgi:hypothetical protein